MPVKWGINSFIRFFLCPGSTTALECPLRITPPFYRQWQQAVPTPFSINYFLPLSTVASNAVAHLRDHINTATISARSTHTNSGVSSLPSSTSTSQPYKHTDLSSAKVQRLSTPLSIWNPLPYCLNMPSAQNFLVYHRYLHISVPLRGGARLIPEGRRERKSKMKVKEKRVLLIDEDSTNLGEMDGDTATKLSESKGLNIVLASKETPERCAVYRLVSGKQLREEEKFKQQKLKKDPRQVTKEITVSTKIGTHDLNVKVTHMKDFLSSLHNVRLVVEPARVPRSVENREESLELERKKQSKMLEEIEKSLEGLGVKIAKENMKRNRLQCTFRSIASQNTMQK